MLLRIRSTGTNSALFENSALFTILVRTIFEGSKTGAPETIFYNAGIMHYFPLCTNYALLTHFDALSQNNALSVIVHRSEKIRIYHEFNALFGISAIFLNPNDNALISYSALLRSMHYKHILIELVYCFD